MKPALAEIERRFLDLMHHAANMHAPYIWGGKGDHIWTPDGIIESPYKLSHGDVFDCSGVITTCLARAGGPDLKFTHGAKQLHQICPNPDHHSATTVGLVLRFYPRHVALKLCEGSGYAGGGQPISVLEAAGGGSLTKTPTVSGYVRHNVETRRDLLGEGSLSLLIAGWLDTGKVPELPAWSRSATW